MKRLTLEEKLFLVNFKVAKEPHLRIIDERVCLECVEKPCLIICPAGNYRQVGEKVIISYEGCLECGACRVVCPKGNIRWHYPLGGFGVRYRFG